MYVLIEHAHADERLARELYEAWNGVGTSSEADERLAMMMMADMDRTMQMQIAEDERLARELLKNVKRRRRGEKGRGEEIGG